MSPRCRGKWPTAGGSSLCSGARAGATLPRADSRKDPSSHNYQGSFTCENLLYIIPFVGLIVLIKARQTSPRSSEHREHISSYRRNVDGTMIPDVKRAPRWGLIEWRCGMANLRINSSALNFALF
jgi:hypothetical protein